MIGSAFSTGLVSWLVGYTLGSIPTAYLVTRWQTGKDIRKLSGENVGGFNALQEVEVLAAIIVTLVDLGKGAATVAITHHALHLEQTYVLISATSAVMGHNWMPWLKFDGGKGMGAAIGSLLVILPVYGYLKEMAILGGLSCYPCWRHATLGIYPGLQMCADVESGAFVRQPDEAMVEELRLMIENLDCTGNLVSDHIGNLLEDVEGKLPGDKEKMPAVIARFQSLSPSERTHFRVGRRAGLYRSLEELNDINKHANVEGIIERLSGGTGEVDDDLVHKLRLAYT